MSASPSRLSLLLPAYLSRTLGDADRRWVEEQLAASADARAELEELKVLKAGLRAHWDSDLAPSPSARSRVMAAIGAPARKEVQPPGFGERLGSALSALFAPKWMPAAALSLIVVQFGLLVAINSIRPPGPDGAIGRGVDFPTHFTLVLKPDAKLSDVTTLLKDLRAEIVSGPDKAGAYVIGVLTDKPALIDEKLKLARARSDVVASIDVEKP